jgi:hypothetical protein
MADAEQEQQEDQAERHAEQPQDDQEHRCLSLLLNLSSAESLKRRMSRVTR